MEYKQMEGCKMEQILRTEKQFYINQLKNNILPFWVKNAIDFQAGGYFTCFENETEKRISTDKYIWSQGRFVWIWSKLSQMNCFSEVEKESFFQYAKLGADFLLEHSVLKNGNCVFLTNRYGEKKKYEGYYDSSYYVDCFVIMGMSKFYSLTLDEEVLYFTNRLVNSVLARLKSKKARSEPYLVPKGYHAHGQHMILLNTIQSYLEALDAGESDEFQYYKEIADNCMDLILDDFTDEEYHIREFVNEEEGIDDILMLERYINPGHTVECLWFLAHQAKISNKYDILMDKIIKIYKATINSGWDNDFGGLFLFADKDGGPPKGNVGPFENEKIIKKVINDWDNKLWWPHSEILYTTLLLYLYCHDTYFKDKYDIIKRYVFDTFPNENEEIGEWIQIRDRKGKAADKVVALPVKDPFHIIRDMILIIDLL